VANWISILRTLMAIGLCAMLLQHPAPEWLWVGLTGVVIWMDGLDGYVARKRNECSEFGAVLDILSDRVVEQAFWITFLALNWVPVVVVLAIVLRGVVVDGLRAIPLSQGRTPFGQQSMMQHPLGILLVSSRFSRWTYAVAKAAAFCLVIACHCPGGASLTVLADALVWITVVFCLLRGLPVLFEVPRYLRSAS
jgi:CDP-diacylglycerol---glycerol-3-phosphate 3-phosphatidyltransferase